MCYTYLTTSSGWCSPSNNLQMSDEVKDAPRNVPYAMMYSILISGAMQLCIMITILFCLGPVETALNTPTGYPIIQVIYGATKSKASATVMMSFVLFNGTVAMFSALASTSRLTWVFGKYSSSSHPCSLD